jgi:hypothetical protein
MVKFSEIIPGKVTMSLKKNPQEELFTATNELKDFLRDDDPMMVFSKTIYSAFKDEDFADCYSTKGRNAKSPSFLALVTLLQFRESLSDTWEALVILPSTPITPTHFMCARLMGCTKAPTEGGDS